MTRKRVKYHLTCREESLRRAEDALHESQGERRHAEQQVGVIRRLKAGWDHVHARNRQLFVQLAKKEISGDLRT